MGNFINDLKKAVESGEFNSDAAKKINTINEYAEKLSGTIDCEKAVEKRLDNAGIRTVTDKDNAILETDFDNQLKILRREELKTKELVMLMDIENAVELTIGDMLSHIQGLKKAFADEFTENSENSDLVKKVNEIELKYSSFIKI